jgi:uncharacterized integral membrane protein (TIGR00698 family)
MAASTSLAIGRGEASSHAAALPGLTVAVGIAALGILGGRLVPLIGPPVLGIVFGVLLSRAARSREALRPGLAFAGGPILQLAVVVLGSQLSLGQVVRVGAGSLPVMLGTLGVCLLLAQVAGRRLGIGRDLRTLVGVGTGICGASAIAAVSPVIRARSSDISYAISTIFLFNVAAVLTFPVVGRLLGLGQPAFGLFAGTAVNDTSSVVAAAASYGGVASQHAVVVKLTRTLMIIPISFALSAFMRRRGAVPDQRHRLLGALRSTPWFLVAFVLVAGANSAGLVPAATHGVLAMTSIVLITVALTAIGLSTDLAGLRAAGPRPLLLGLVLWLAVATTSLLLQLLVA